MKLLKGIQRRDMKMMKDLVGMYKEQLKACGMLSLEKRLRGDLKAV